MKRGRPSLNYVNWYAKIKAAEALGAENLIDLITKAQSFFEEERENADKMFHQGDKLLDVIRNHMQYVNYYNNIHTQLELLDTFYGNKIKQAIGRILREWDKNPPTNFALSKTDKSNLVEDVDEVQNLRAFHDLFHEQYKFYTAILKSLEAVGFNIGHLSRLRAAGQEEALL